MIKIQKPKKEEYNPDIVPYIDLIPDDEQIIKHLANNLKKTKSFLLSIPRKKFQYRYAENKWTIKEVCVHIMDHERIYAYRALRIARNDKTPLPGYNADDYASYSRANEKNLKEILEEYDAVRNATISLFKSFDEAAFLGTGIAIGHPVSVRALASHIAGHEFHHINIIKERYL